MSRSYRTNHDDVYGVGDIIRYEYGSTALMRITSISLGHGGAKARYYGVQCLDGICAAYHDQCERPSDEDLRMWESRADSRRHTEARLFWDRHPVDVAVDIMYLHGITPDADRIDELRRCCDERVVPPELQPR